MKRLNPRRVKVHRNYTVEEAAKLFDVHKNTVRGWLKDGLARIDGQRPTAKLRSKMKVVEVAEVRSLSDLPDWSFDGSSTYQAEGKT